jgi:hypothetical protein
MLIYYYFAMTLIVLIPSLGFGESAEQAELANKLMHSGGNPLPILLLV